MGSIDNAHDRMSRTYLAWADEQGIANPSSADEMLCRDDLTGQQRRWLSEFLRRWERVEALGKQMDEFADSPIVDSEIIRASMYLEEARNTYASEGEIEIDDSAIVSVSSDGGAYVEAWVWISDSDLE